MKKNSHHSKETKRKIAFGVTGKKNGMKQIGARKKIGEANKKRIQSEATRKKISEKMKGNQIMAGRKLSTETRKKMSEANKGEKGNNWKGGITPENRRIRDSIELRLWREAVFARDNWTCQKCGQKGGVLHSHHIKGFAKYPGLRTSIENGVTLCKKCHKKYHKKS